jgi:transcriptional regulator with XRE-family HTH domain
MSQSITQDTPIGVTQTYDNLVRGWVQENFTGVKFAAKKLADMAKVSTRTAEGWVQGRRTPGNDDLINLCVECPDLVELLITEVQRRKAMKKTA